MSATRNNIIEGILAREGGYVNDPADAGGETNHGITIAVARRYGYEGPMRDLPRELAYEIYVEMYWHSLRLDEIEPFSAAIAEELADTGVNMGTSRAAQFLQRSLNVLNNAGQLYDNLKVDGQLGPITLRALRRYLEHRGADGELVLLRMLNALQGAFYVELAERRETDQRFIFGWFLHRVTIPNQGVLS